MSGLAATPEPPYYVVVFTSLRSDVEAEEYAAAAAEMAALAARQDGYLGMESARDPQGLGITVSYWRDLDAIAAWRDHAEHRIVQRLGRDRWYRSYALRVACVERQTVFDPSNA